MAEVHIIGQIESAAGFEDTRLACRWSLHIGGGWRVVEGERDGQTQCDLPLGEHAFFCHPIDVHLATRTMQGWPRVQLEVWRHDDYARLEVCGYGSVVVPMAPGEHKLECHCWRPKGGVREELVQRFVGGGLQLRSLDILGSAASASDRRRLRTVATGVVTLRLAVITRHFDRFGIQC